MVITSFKLFAQAGKEKFSINFQLPRKILEPRGENK